MTPSRPSDPLVSQLLEHLTDHHALPAGWHELHLSGVDRPIVVGPGGLVVLGTRQATISHPDLAPHRPWQADRREQRSTVQLTAELVSELVAAATGVSVPCVPVIVITDDHTQIVPRPDQVAVIHQRRFARWLATRPIELDRATIGLVLDRLAARATTPAR